MENVVVSIIIPLYNEEKYIDACIQSLIKQTYPSENMEWILVDGIDYIIHLFLPDARIKYSLEKLYCDVDIIKVD